jgi:hypothetical protein
MRQSFPNARHHTPADGTNIQAVDAGSLSAKACVRYVGFESIADGRRLRFRVKSTGQAAIEVTFDIPDTVFAGRAEVSIQDAAPMAFEKLVELLATADTIQATRQLLTAADIAAYVNRHDSHKSGHSRSDRTRHTDIAA